MTYCWDNAHIVMYKQREYVLALELKRDNHNQEDTPMSENKTDTSMSENKTDTSNECKTMTVADYEEEVRAIASDAARMIESRLEALGGRGEVDGACFEQGVEAGVSAAGITMVLEMLKLM